MNDILNGGIEVMFVQGENLVMFDFDQVYVCKVLLILKYLVVQDIFLIEIVWYVDVILLVFVYVEKFGIYININWQVQIGWFCVLMLGEVWVDWEILIDFVNYFGLNWDYDGVLVIYEEMCFYMVLFNNIFWDCLEQDGIVIYLVDVLDKLGNEILFG